MSYFKYFSLNGHQYCTKKKLSLLNLINYFDYDISLLVLEYNSIIFEQKDWKKTLIKNHDRIEIITLVGGG